MTGSVLNSKSDFKISHSNSKNPIEKNTEKCYATTAVNKADSLKGELPMNRQEAKITALYERLSREDDDVQGESNSIQNQKQYLLEYAKNQGFTNIRHYTDDGTSGVRFQREAWQELISDVENGKVATILTKDMSRVGREHVQVGVYMELFRKAEVRFIAVSNNIDSLYPETLEFAPFLNIMNEWYARDISRKIKTVKRSNGRNEKYTSSIAPYGYRKSETEKGVWEIDPEAAEIVKRIFRMTIGWLRHLCSSQPIAKGQNILPRLLSRPARYRRLQKQAVYRPLLLAE